MPLPRSSSMRASRTARCARCAELETALEGHAQALKQVQARARSEMRERRDLLAEVAFYQRETSAALASRDAEAAEARRLASALRRVETELERSRALDAAVSAERASLRRRAEDAEEALCARADALAEASALASRLEAAERDLEAMRDHLARVAREKTEALERAADEQRVRLNAEARAAKANPSSPRTAASEPTTPTSNDVTSSRGSPWRATVVSGLRRAFER